MARKIREVVEEVEGVVVEFLAHVRHDGKDYQHGDSAEIAPEHAAKLIELGAAKAVVAVEPAGDPAAGDAASADAEASE